MAKLYDPSPVEPMKDKIRIRWLGHASFFIETKETSLLFDPNWSETIPFLGPIPLYYRSVPPGLEFEKMPPVKHVFLSHTHRDHFDEDKHFNVEQGIDLLQTHLKPKGKIIPMHWGTWPFNEFGCDLMKPYKILKETLKKKDPALANQLHRLKVGECLKLV